MAYAGQTGGRALNRFLANQGLIQTLNSNNATIATINAGTISTANATITDATIVDLSAVDLNVTNEIVGETIVTTNATFTNTTSITSAVTDGVITTLTTTSGFLTNADITNLLANSATLITSNIGNATGTSLVINGNIEFTGSISGNVEEVTISNVEARITANEDDIALLQVDLIDVSQRLFDSQDKDDSDILDISNRVLVNEGDIADISQRLFDSQDKDDSDILDISGRVETLETFTTSISNSYLRLDGGIMTGDLSVNQNISTSSLTVGRTDISNVFNVFEVDGNARVYGELRVDGSLNIGPATVTLFDDGNGVLRMEHSSGTGMIFDLGQTNPTIKPLLTTSTDSKVLIDNTNDTNTTPQLDLGTDGKVGIGVSDPSGTLHVSGDVYIEHGNVGIGTTTPAFKLDVDGTLNATGATTIGSTLDVTGNTAVTGTLDITGATTLNSTLDVTGNTAVTGTLDITGATTLNSTLDVTGVTNINDTTQSTNSTTGALVVDGGIGVAKDIITRGHIEASGNSVFYSTASAAEGGIQVIKYNGTTKGSIVNDNSFHIYGTNTDIYLNHGGKTTPDVNTILNAGGSTGNVGIGTTTPAYKLDLYNSSSTSGINARFISVSDSILRIGSQLGQPESDINWQNGDTLGEIQFGAEGQLGGFVQYPASIAGVANDSYTSGGGNFNIRGSLEFRVASDTGPIGDDSANRQTKMTITHNGDVGIGTTIPSHKLDIVGTTRVNDITDATTSNTGAFIVEGGALFKKNVNVSGGITVQGNGAVDGAMIRLLSYDSTDWGIYSSTNTSGEGIGETTPQNYGSVTNRAVRFRADSTDAGYGFIWEGKGAGNPIPVMSLTASTGELRVKGPTTIENTLDVSGVTNVNDTTDSDLDNNAALVVDGGATIKKSMRIGYVKNNKDGVLIGYPYGTTYANHGYIQGITSANGTGALNINPAGGNVGIGTNNPTYKLDVSGTMRVAQSSKLYLGSKGHIVNNGIYTDISSTNDMRILGSSGTTMYFSHGGNIGVGVDPPAYKFDVNGTVRATGATTLGSTLDVAGFTRITDTTTSSDYTSGALVVSGGVGVAQNLNIGGTVTATGPLRIGNVQIEQSPANFHTINFNGYYTGAASQAHDISKNVWRIVHDTRESADRLVIDTLDPDSGYSATNILVAQTDGNVGIGSIDPIYKLDVSGTMRATGVTRITNNSNSTLPTNGALIVSGGVGVGNNLNVTGIINGISTIQCVGNEINDYSLYVKAKDTDGRGICFANSGFNYLYAIKMTSAGHLVIENSNVTGGNNYGGNLYLRSRSDVYLGLTDNVVVKNTGRLGIGTTGPGFPLEVVGAILTTGGAGYQYTKTGQASYSDSDINVSAKFDNTVWATLRVVVSSDRRIKNNINDISDNNALDLFRNIQPKTYEYIDKHSRGSNTVYGFIAQEVKDVIPNAVTITKNIIPDYYKQVSHDASYDTSTNMTTLIIEHDVTYNVDTSHNVRVYVLDNSSQETKIEAIPQFIDDKHFSIQSDQIKDVSSVFLYGKEVDDFHTLNKDAIWTVATAALQEVDRNVEKLRKKNHIMRGKVSLLSSAGSSTGVVILPLDDTEFTNPQVFLQNNEGWSQVKGTITGNTLTVVAKDADCTDTIDYMVTVDLLE